MKNENIIVEIFVSIISIIAATLIFISQKGFDYSSALLVKTICITLFMIYTPALVNRYFNRKYIIEWYSTKACILLGSLIILVIAGLIGNLLDIDLSIYFALFGFAVMIIAARAYVTNILQISLIHIIPKLTLEIGDFRGVR